MDRGSVLILNYHRISDQEESDTFAVKTSVLEEQLRLIKETSIPIISINELGNKALHQNFSIALTFDDGYCSDYELVLPLLEKYGWPAAFFPIVNRMDEPDRLCWGQLKHLADKGFVIGSHGMTHTALSSATLLQQELEASKKILEEKINKRVEHFAPPYGWYDKKTIQAAKQAGYKCLMGTGLKINSTVAAPFVFHRWNMTNNLSPSLFKKIVLSNGNIPAGIKALAHVRRYAKKVLGPELSDHVNKLF